jgi:hypothetical protein
MASSDLLVTFVSKRDSLNRLADALAKTKVYMEVGTPTPRLRDPELDFIRVVSWLYIHHVEAGATSIKFLTGLFDGFAVDGDRRGRSHVTDIGRIRAELQHNLVSDSFSDQITKRHCERWYLAACGTRMPGARKHWTLCVRRILSDAIALLEALEECLRALEADAGLEEKIIIWRRRLTRSYSPADFDRVVETVDRDLGREGLGVTMIAGRASLTCLRTVPILKKRYGASSRLVWFMSRYLGPQLLVWRSWRSWPLSRGGPWVGCSNLQTSCTRPECETDAN